MSGSRLKRSPNTQTRIKPTKPAGVQRHVKEAYAFMRTTIDLPDPVFRRLKASAALEGLSLKELILRAVEKELLARS